MGSKKVSPQVGRWMAPDTPACTTSFANLSKRTATPPAVCHFEIVYLFACQSRSESSVPHDTSNSRSTQLCCISMILRCAAIGARLSGRRTHPSPHPHGNRDVRTRRDWSDSFSPSRDR
ncbi:hypothetical protein PsYK624_019840 [Phanerochaete sordida]|uniref:Uncharacterized protein n=1 Tax=Phanerochaete sordida TaxID=48140 RepID=A0A9P3G1C5_9APHY|nr:hypothetical protein PsYK624_019840 [Phanerochaete sordida]